MRLPADTVTLMERFGRHTIDRANSTENPDTVWETFVAPFFPIAQSDPGGFVTALARVLRPVGGWAGYGGMRLIVEVLGGDFEHPAADEVRTAALDFLRSRGVPNASLTGYEWQFWLAHKGQTERWLVGRPRPSLEEAPITDIEPGHIRRVVKLLPDEDSNLILVRHAAGGGYESVVDARRNEQDARRVRNRGLYNATLDGLYWDIGCGLQTPPFWVNRELRPYFPLQRPNLD